MHNSQAMFVYQFTIAQQVLFLPLKKIFSESSLQEQAQTETWGTNIIKASASSELGEQCPYRAPTDTEYLGKPQQTAFVLVLLFIGFKYLLAQAQGLASAIGGGAEEVVHLCWTEGKLRNTQCGEQEGQIHESWKQSPKHLSSLQTS